MQEFAKVLDDVRVWPISDAGVYELARIVVPANPPYIIDLIMQGVFNDNGEISDQIVWNGDALWQLRLDTKDTRGAGDYIGPGIADRSVQGNPLPGGWPDRSVISDGWRFPITSHIIVNGSAILRLFVTIGENFPTSYSVGGRLRAREWPSKA